MGADNGEPIGNARENAMRINRKKIRPLVIYTHKIEPEDLPVKGNVQASGDDEEDRKAELWVSDQLDSGNVAAWCHVVVTASALGVSASTSLSGCSYDSVETLNQDLLPELQEEAFTNLCHEIQRLADLIPSVADKE